MDLKYLGNSKEKIPEIGIGTWKMGINPSAEADALRTAIEYGMRFIDTAEMYGTEWIVGNALKGSKGAFVATKVSPNHFRYKDVINACNASLRNLNLRQIDLYQLHWPNHSVPIKETMKAMEDLADSGKIRHIGVSNFSIKELVDAQNSMKKYDIMSNQVEYSLLVREIEDELLDFCISNKITIIAYSPFARGAIFSSKSKRMLDKLEAIAAAHNKTAAQVVLNWIISRRNVVAIPKASNIKHVIEDAGASGWKLAKAEQNELDSLEERKKSLAGFFQPVIKSTGIWARAAHRFYNKKRKAGNLSESSP